MSIILGSVEHVCERTLRIPGTVYLPDITSKIAKRPGNKWQMPAYNLKIDYCPFCGEKLPSDQEIKVEVTITL